MFFYNFEMLNLLLLGLQFQIILDIYLEISEYISYGRNHDDNIAVVISNYVNGKLNGKIT